MLFESVSHGFGNIETFSHLSLTAMRGVPFFYLTQIIYRRIFPPKKRIQNN